MRTLPSLAAAALSGLMLAAVFPGFNLWPLAFLALTPLLMVLERARGWRRAVGPLFGLSLFFLVLLYWIPRVLGLYGGLPAVAGWGALLLLAAALALFYLPVLICFLFLLPIRAWLAYLLFPFAWVACDLIRNFWMVNGFPWGSLGYSQIDRPWAQVADLGGVYLVTFLVAAVNSALAYAWLNRRVVVPVLLSALLMASASGYGLVRMRQTYPPALRVGVVQPVIDLASSSQALSQRYLVDYPASIAQLAGQGARLIVLPEAPSEFDYYKDEIYRTVLEAAARTGRVSLAFNNTTVGIDGRYYNSIVYLAPDGSLAGRYDKIHLVPFGEYVPWAGTLPFLRPLVQEVSHFSAGRDIVVVDAGGVPVGGFLCYEAIFPELVRGFAEAGARLLVNLTDDAWYGRTAAPAQHLQIARMRAIETRRFLVRAANSGISAIVDPQGRVTAQLGLFQKGTLLAAVAPLESRSFYVSRGNLFAQACVWVMAAGLASIRIRALMSRTRK